MNRVHVSEQPQQQQQQAARPQVLSLEEIERQMMAGAPEPAPQQPPQPQYQQPPPPQRTHSIPPPSQPQQREATPVQSGLAGSGYASGQALLDSMFPELGQAPAQSQPTANFASDAQARPPGPSPEQLAHMQAMHERIKGKIQAMSRYNNLMGSSDKDFITRIQLSQLASADPYSSDFYAQVFSALRRQQAEEEGPTVVKLTAGLGFGVGGPAGNRFGKMGSATMSKLSKQVKQLVETRQLHQKQSMGSGECIPKAEHELS